MGPGQNFLTRVGSPIHGLGLNLENFPLGQKKSLQLGSKGTQVKGESASYLLRVKSKLRSRPISS